MPRSYAVARMGTGPNRAVVVPTSNGAPWADGIAPWTGPGSDQPVVSALRSQSGIALLAQSDVDTIT